MNISYFLIKQMIEDKTIRHLCVLIKLKSVYVSGAVHDYSPYKLSKSCDISRNSVKKYVDWAILNGYARIDGGDLKFTKFTKIESKYKWATIMVDPTLPIKKMSDLLHREILCDGDRKFRYLISKKEDSINPMGKDALHKLKKAKKALRNLKDVELLPNASEKYTVSIKLIAKKFKCSVGKAQGIVNSLCEDNLLKRITNYCIIKQDTKSNRMHKNYAKEYVRRNKGTWYTGGLIIMRKTNSYVF